MTTSTDLVFEATSTYINTPCPDWCNLRILHPVDNRDPDGVDFRLHGGMLFGNYLHGIGEEYVDEPGVLYVGVVLETEDPVEATHLDLAQFAEETEEARAWLTAQLRERNRKPLELRR